MSPLIDSLLPQLESVTARIFEMTEAALSAGDNIVQISDLVSERGLLVKQLDDLLAKNSPLSYSDWNRLVVIHNQGQRIEMNLQSTRGRIVNQIAMNARGQAFLNCVAGVVETPDVVNSTNI